MSDAYAHVRRGKLSLKGGFGKMKKKKRKQKRVEKRAKELSMQAKKDQVQAKKSKSLDDDSTTSSPTKSDQEQGAGDALEFPPMTEAERKFHEAQRAREAKLIEEKIQKTHRARIEEYNAYLASLSEHHDLPKVGPG